MQSFRYVTLFSAPLWLSGCSAALWGNLAVLGVTVGIFLGTVFLSRASASATSRSTASTASPTQPRG